MDSEEEYEISTIKEHRSYRNKMQYLVGWKGFDALEDMWLTEDELHHAADILTSYKQQHNLRTLLAGELHCTHCRRQHIDEGRYATLNHRCHVC